MDPNLAGYPFPPPWGYQPEPGSTTHVKVTDAHSNTVAEHVPVIAAAAMCQGVNAQMRFFLGDHQPSEADVICGLLDRARAK